AQLPDRAGEAPRETAGQPRRRRIVTQPDCTGGSRRDEPPRRTVSGWAASDSHTRSAIVRRGRGRRRPRGRADAPTAPWKTADRFPPRPPPSSSSVREERQAPTAATGRRQQPESTVVASGSFADPSPAEIVVA